MQSAGLNYDTYLIINHQPPSWKGRRELSARVGEGGGGGGVNLENGGKV